MVLLSSVEILGAAIESPGFRVSSTGRAPFQCRGASWGTCVVSIAVVAMGSWAAVTGCVTGSGFPCVGSGTAKRGGATGPFGAGGSFVLLPRRP